MSPPTGLRCFAVMHLLQPTHELVVKGRYHSIREEICHPRFAKHALGYGLRYRRTPSGLKHPVTIAVVRNEWHHYEHLGKLFIIIALLKNWHS